MSDNVGKQEQPKYRVRVTVRKSRRPWLPPTTTGWLYRGRTKLGFVSGLDVRAHNEMLFETDNGADLVQWTNTGDLRVKELGR